MPLPGQPPAGDAAEHVLGGATDNYHAADGDIHRNAGRQHGLAARFQIVMHDHRVRSLAALPAR